MNKTKTQKILYILVGINLVATLILLFLIFRLGNYATYSVIKDTYNHTILKTEIECIKNPLPDCKEKLENLEKDFKTWNENQTK